MKLLIPFSSVFNRQSEKVRFLLVGGINTFVGFLVFPALYYIFDSYRSNLIALLLVSFLICTTFSFLTNKFLVFRTAGDIHRQYLRFMSLQLFTLLLNLIFLPALVDIFGLNPILAQTIFTATLVYISFLWHQRITFKKLKER